MAASSRSRPRPGRPEAGGAHRPGPTWPVSTNYINIHCRRRRRRPPRGPSAAARQVSHLPGNLPALADHHALKDGPRPASSTSSSS
eukprot:2033494-Pyramimonas_sp.AAC.1